MSRRVAVASANDTLHLTGHALSLVRRAGDGCQASQSFAVEAQVLREGLRYEALLPSCNEEADSGCVMLHVAAGEALVSKVKESEVVPLFEALHDGSPLLQSGVNAGGIVSACVEQDNGAFGCRLGMMSVHSLLEQQEAYPDVFQESSNVQAVEERVVVPVVGLGNARFSQNVLVVSCCTSEAFPSMKTRAYPK